MRTILVGTGFGFGPGLRRGRLTGAVMACPVATNIDDAIIGYDAENKACQPLIIYSCAVSGFSSWIWQWTPLNLEVG